MSEYELKAIEFLMKTGTSMKINYVGVVHGFPFEEEGVTTYPHRKYKVTMRRNGRVFTTPFYGSYMDFKNGKNPTSYDILACLEKYEVSENMWDFATEYGYEIKSESSYNRVQNIWKSCKTQYKKLIKFFDYDENIMDELREIY